MKLIKFIPILILIFSVIACIEDTIQLEDVSTEMNVTKELAFPAINISLQFDDIAGHGYDSLIITSGDTIFLYLLEDIRLEDTIDLGGIGENMEFVFLNLHHKITNYFPVGLDLKLYLYDDATGQNIDTIWFSDPDELFIDPAPSDANGLAIEDQVVTDNSYVALSQNVLDNLFNETTQLVLFIEVPSTGGFVKILRTHRLNIHFGIEVRWRNTTDTN